MFEELDKIIEEAKTVALKLMKYLGLLVKTADYPISHRLAWCM